MLRFLVGTFSRSLPFDAVLLAAGRSSRMGRDKALLDHDGIPLWRRQRDTLAQAGATELFLSARPDQSWARHADGFNAVLHDALPGCGPIVGITAALERAAEPLVAALAIDLPAISAGWFQTLLPLCTRQCGAVARRGNSFEPLAAIYPRTMIWQLWEALARCEYSLQRTIALAIEKGMLRVREIDPAEEALFENWNAPAASGRMGPPPTPRVRHA